MKKNIADGSLVYVTFSCKSQVFYQNVCAVSTIKYAHLQNWYSMEWNIHTSSFSGTSGTVGFQTQLKSKNSILLEMQVFDAMLVQCLHFKENMDINYGS